MIAQAHQNEISEIWKILKDVSIRFKETEQRFKDTEQMFKETDQKFKETDQKFKETDQKFKETEQGFKDTKQMFKDTNQELKMASNETNKKIKALAKLFEDQWGKLMESLIEGGILDLFKNIDIDVNEVHQRVKKSKNGNDMEIDLLLENGTEVIIVEVKTTLRANHIDDFLHRMSIFPEFFYKYKNHVIYGAVAALRIEQAADRYAEKNGLYVVKVGNNNLISLINHEGFTPKTFGERRSGRVGK
jgi:hypothetical protein